MRLCKDSTNPLCHGWPGGMNAWSVSCSLAQRPTAPAMNSGPLSALSTWGAPFRVELEINGPHLPRSASLDQALQAQCGACGLCAGTPAALRRATSAGTYHALRQCPRSWPAPRRVYSPIVDAWRQNRSSTGVQAHDHAAFSPRPPRRCGNTLTGTARQRARARR